MTAFLLENGADLNIVSAYLADTIDDSHSEVFLRFLVDSSLTMARAKKIMVEEKLNGLLVCDQGKFLGSLSPGTFARAEKSGRMETSVKGFMKPKVPVVAPGETARKALELMNLSDDGLLPVVDQTRVIGVLTRGNLILHIYDI